ncbi:unnamed protein product, partial [Musa hybrid cultivar]
DVTITAVDPPETSGLSYSGNRLQLFTIVPPKLKGDS